MYVKKEEDATRYTAVRKIHKILNHKKEDQMLFAYRNAGKLNPEVSKNIKAVIKHSEICSKNESSKSKPAVAISKATDFNSIVALDQKEMESMHILWMICGFTRFIKGVIVKDKKAESIIQGLHNEWYLNFEFPTVVFYADNGGEFRNYKMEEFMNKLGINFV